MRNNKPVSTHQFAMVPRVDIPRSSFVTETAHKSTIDAGYLVPFYVDEALPGDHVRVQAHMFGRLATPIFPVMDNLHIDTFYFFVPNRIIWDNWTKFMGEQKNPGDSIDYLIPEMTSPADGYPVNSIYDYLGLPTQGQVAAGKTVKHSALPLRAYNLIYNEWFRDQNLIDSIEVPTGDGPDKPELYQLRRRGKRHDYFTSALPWPQKGNPVTIPLVGNAPVLALPEMHGGFGTPVVWGTTDTGVPPGRPGHLGFQDDGRTVSSADAITGAVMTLTPRNLWADLSGVSAATVNDLRFAFQMQRALERFARGGSRYVEMLQTFFGVSPQDARLQRPEYLGGGHTLIRSSPVAQTSQTNESTPLGELAAFATGASSSGFSYAAQEHGFFIGIACIRADLSYQQGLRRMWSRQTRFDFYLPPFAHLGEQAIKSKELFCDGTEGDELVFGYQERWAEYRYNPSLITGMFRSTAAQPLDAWHLSQRFANRPTLSQDFIEERPPVERVIAVGEAAAGKQFIFDSLLRIKWTRAMPLYSVPGLIDHF